MYVYDSKEKIFVWLKKIPESEQKDNVDRLPSGMREAYPDHEIKSILKTSTCYSMSRGHTKQAAEGTNKFNTVKIAVPVQRYLVFPDEKIYKICKKNIHDTHKFITKHKLKDSFLHFSMHKIEKLDPFFTNTELKSDKHKSLYYNPKGLWLSHGSSWIDYVDNNIKYASNSNLYPYIYRIEVFDTVKLITNKDELFKFIKTYKKKPNDIKLYDVIDWNRVKTDFTGLIITPWLGDKIWHLSKERMEIIGGEVAHDFFVDLMGNRWKNNMILLSEWYRHWECASGVIWNINGISSCDLIKETDFSKYI
jgi:hypothetical protein